MLVLLPRSNGDLFLANTHIHHSALLVQTGRWGVKLPSLLEKRWFLLLKLLLGQIRRKYAFVASDGLFWVHEGFLACWMGHETLLLLLVFESLLLLEGSVVLDHFHEFRVLAFQGPGGEGWNFIQKQKLTSRVNSVVLCWDCAVGHRWGFWRVLNIYRADCNRSCLLKLTGRRIESEIIFTLRCYWPFGLEIRECFRSSVYLLAASDWFLRPLIRNVFLLRNNVRPFDIRRESHRNATCRCDILTLNSWIPSRKCRR